jgi:hypothetical protein
MTTVTQATRTVFPKGGVLVDQTPSLNGANARSPGIEYANHYHCQFLDACEGANFKSISVKPSASKIISLSAAAHNLCDINESVLGPFTINATANFIANTTVETALTQPQGGVLAVATRTAGSEQVFVEPIIEFGASFTAATRQIRPVLTVAADVLDASTGITYKRFAVAISRCDGLSTALTTPDSMTLKYIITRIKPGHLE